MKSVAFVFQNVEHTKKKNNKKYHKHMLWQGIWLFYIYNWHCVKHTTKPIRYYGLNGLITQNGDRCFRKISILFTTAATTTIIIVTPFEVRIIEKWVRNDSVSVMKNWKQIKRKYKRIIKKKSYRLVVPTDSRFLRQHLGSKTQTVISFHQKKITSNRKVKKKKHMKIKKKEKYWQFILNKCWWT